MNENSGVTQPSTSPGEQGSSAHTKTKQSLKKSIGNLIISSPKTEKLEKTEKAEKTDRAGEKGENKSESISSTKGNKLKSISLFFF